MRSCASPWHGPPARRLRHRAGAGLGRSGRAEGVRSPVPLSAMSTVSTREAVLALVERFASAIRPVAVGEPRLVGLYLFGSRAGGDAHAASDFDLGALFTAPLDVWQLLGLQARLAKAVGADVDLVDAAAASPFLALDVVCGERLYCADADACDTFELYVLRRAGDLAPFERQRRNLLLGRGAQPVPS